MIKSVVITNHLGESVTLELKNPEKSGFFVRGGIDGLGPSKAEINTTEILSSDGSDFNSARVTKRNVVFRLGFLENPTIEATRYNSYKFFPIKKRIKMVIETDTRKAQTYGYVETNEPDIFSQEEGADISVICPEAYLVGTEQEATAIGGARSLFEFPFSNESLTENLIIISEITSVAEMQVNNVGDASVGFTLYIHATGAASNIQIIHRTSNLVMSIDSSRLAVLTGSDIVDGDDIVISTIYGNKYIGLWRNGVYYNILNCLGKNPDWIQLEEGLNSFAFTADYGLSVLQFRIENDILYEGV